MAATAMTRKSVTDLTRRKARAFFTVLTLAIAVASIGIFAVPSLLQQAMDRKIASTRLADLTLTMNPLAMSDAPRSTCSSTFDRITMLPAKIFRPAGITTRPPPALWQASMAAWMAGAWFVFASATMPKSDTEKSLMGDPKNDLGNN